MTAECPASGPVQGDSSSDSPLHSPTPSPFQADAAPTVDLASSASSLVSQFIHGHSHTSPRPEPSSPDIPQHVFKRHLPPMPPRTPPSPVDPVVSAARTQQNDSDAAARRIQRAWRHHHGLMKRSFCHFGGEAVRLVERFISGAGFEERAASKAHLLLHFDINKTILISDAAKGAGQADMINVLLSECVWGRMTVGPAWVPVGRLATDRPLNDPQLMSYRNFLDSFLYPYIEGSSQEVREENTRRKKLCHELQRKFTASGEPGEMFVGVFHALAARMSQPRAEMAPFFGAGERRLLPSFFELLLHLHRTGRRFTVVFRTFGTDVKDVVEEMNMFATGRHPSYPGVELAGQGATDLRLAIPHSTGAFLRSGHGEGDTVLALGVDDEVLEARQMTRQLLEESVAKSGGALIHGFSGITQVFSACAESTAPRRSNDSDCGALSAASSASGAAGAVWVRKHGAAKNRAFAIRDYYHFWKQRNERPRAGKLLLCNPDDTSVISMFFDDNIGHSSAHIVDARDARTGETIPFSRAKNAHLIRAEPVNAILDPMYFVRCGPQCPVAACYAPSG